MGISVKKDDRKKEIIEVAKNMFLTYGYEKSTVESIINAMGVSKGMFYHYYKSKEDVLNDVLDDFADSMTKNVVDILKNDNKNAKEKIMELFTYKRAMISKMNNMSDLTNNSFWGSFYSNISKKSLEIINPYFKKLILDGVAEGHFKIKYPKVTAFIFTGLFISAGSMSEEYSGLFEDVEESLRAGKDIAGRLLGCDINE